MVSMKIKFKCYRKEIGFDMQKIFYLIGKSSSGKDTIYRHLLKKKELNLKPVVLYTTRPIRDGEKNGVEYFFTTTEELESLSASNKIIEQRSYQTVLGVWHYFTVNDKQFSSNSPLLMIGTLESFINTRNYFGKEYVIPLYIEVEDGIRLERALKREQTQINPNYLEMCRRFLADHIDFSDEKLLESGINQRFKNNNLNECISQIVSFIQTV